MADIREKIFDDLATIDEFAAAINKSPRQLKRLGFPTVKIGRTPFIVISKAKAKLMGEGDDKPKRGRPRVA